MKDKNILFSAFELPPFKNIKLEDYEPAILWAIDKARERINQIAESGEEPSFYSVIAPMEYCNRELDRISSILFNLNHADTSDKMQDIVISLSPVLTNFANSIFLNIPLFNRVKSVYESPMEGLTALQRRVTEKCYESFIRHGANLPEDKRVRYREITEELAMKSLLFDQNVLAATNGYIKHITDSAKLIGLPDFVIEAAKAEAEERGMEGWAITLQAQSMVPFMQYSECREIREEIFRKYGSRCYSGEENSNIDIVKDIVNLRLEKAQLLGFSTHAEYVLKERMAERVDRVDDFLEELLSPSLSVAKEELSTIIEFARKNGFDGKFQSWDFAYYSEKYRKEILELSEEQLKPYFELSKVMDSLFELCGRLYGITFAEDSSIECYHEDVNAYRVYESDGKELAVLYVDIFPRATKSGGAWMTTFREYYEYEGREYNPQVSVVCNFSKPTTTKPSLLTFNEVTTLFHEFGHALHAIFSRLPYPSISGTSVAWDFVELPSQIMENWALEREFLFEVARHYETGEPIPSELIDRLIASRNFLSGIMSVRQLSFGLEDMAWHTIDKPFDGELREFSIAATKECILMPIVAGNCFATAFSHIFSGGYSAGYYSYKWAEVLEADAFTRFQKEGVFNCEVAADFRKKVLSKGGSDDAMKLYIDFMGREPKVEALLDKLGLTTKVLQ